MTGNYLVDASIVMGVILLLAKPAGRLVGRIIRRSRRCR